MAQRMTTQMAIAMAVANVRDMAHSTPLHYCYPKACIHGSAALSEPAASMRWALRAEIGGQ